MPATLRLFSEDDIDWLVDQHAYHYAHNEGFDDSFGPLVRDILEEFAETNNPDRERGWIACDGDMRLGSIFCVRLNDDTAKLRVFYLCEAARGQGLGKRLLDECMHFARMAGYQTMTLWTHESHRAACALYAKTGWRITAQRPVTSFGVALVEQTWEVDLQPG